jgi:polysaccharide pyruvyl transferase WcaK-like protein
LVTSNQRQHGRTSTNGTVRRVLRSNWQHQGLIMRSLLLLFIGIPIPIIILLWLLLGHA